MDWEAVGAIGQVLGSVAVSVTLGYLAVQVRQTVAHAQFSSTNATLALFANGWAGVMQNPSMAKVQAKMETREELSREESA